MWPLEPVAYVEAARQQARDDFWGQTLACIRLSEAYTAEALQGLDAFSHVEILFGFHRVDPARIVTAARHPRNNSDWPAVGIFAQRGKNRPNRLGSTICQIQRLEGPCLWVAELDAIDGTPVFDIKPVLPAFLPRTPVQQPAWAEALMQAYWLPEEA